MEPAKIIRQMASLPPEVQQQVIDFVAFLKARHSSVPADKKVKQPRLADEPFVGMWRTRKDARDSTAWVRSLRQREWERGS